MTRFIFVTGGVVSSLGKGVTSGILGALLQSAGYKVRIRKLDPYLNVDPGTINPSQHGEVFVTEDGAETDLDLGHYERFTNVDAKKGDNITTGKIYSDLLAQERKGKYLGETVQIIPHVTNLIKSFIFTNKDNVDFLICEIGGTVGDIEAQPFLEAIRQISYDLSSKKTIFIHVVLIPYIKVAKELKTKPAQHSVKELRSIGIQPDILLCRTEKRIPLQDTKKLALFCNVKAENVIQGLDQKNTYRALITYHEAGLCKQVLNHFNLLNKTHFNVDKWYELIEKIDNAQKKVIIAVVGKYLQIKDSYKSLVESLMHAGVFHQSKVEIKWVDAGSLKLENIETKLFNCGGILVPGGFGARNTEGKVLAIKYAREKKIPFLGICLGMQLAAIEFAKNVLNIKDATSSEFAEKGTKIIGKMSEWAKEGRIEKRTNNHDIGGTMRLGRYDCIIKKETLAYKIYQKDKISERHRHRYEFNINFKEQFEKNKMISSGISPDHKLIEIIELKEHPFFIGVQFHPELKSRAFLPHPIFIKFIKIALPQ